MAIAELVDRLGRPYHELLGINLRSSKFEVVLSRLGRLYCNKSKCEECPVYRGCKRF